MAAKFDTLRTLARKRRDKAIREVHSDYEAALVKIAELEYALLGRGEKRNLCLGTSLQAVMSQPACNDRHQHEQRS